MNKEKFGLLHFPHESETVSSHKLTLIPEGAWRSTGVSTHRWPREMVRMSFTHTWREKKAPNKGRSTPQCVIYMSANRMWEDRMRPTGEGFSSAPLSLSSFPHPLCRRRNRRLSGLIHGRRSASYITALLSPGWTVQFARRLIKAPGLRWHPLSTTRASQGQNMSVQSSCGMLKTTLKVVIGHLVDG